MSEHTPSSPAVHPPAETPRLRELHPGTPPGYMIGVTLLIVAETEKAWKIEGPWDNPRGSTWLPKSQVKNFGETIGCCYRPERSIVHPKPSRFSVPAWLYLKIQPLL